MRLTIRCPQCKLEVAFHHWHDCAHGLEETHIEGSERFVCPMCGEVVHAEHPEADRFPFCYDKLKNDL